MKGIALQPFPCCVSLADIRTLDALQVSACGVDPRDAFGLSTGHPQIQIQACRLQGFPKCRATKPTCFYRIKSGPDDIPKKGLPTRACFVISPGDLSAHTCTAVGPVWAWRCLHFHKIQKTFPLSGEAHLNSIVAKAITGKGPHFIHAACQEMPVLALWQMVIMADQAPG
jgi:hypothetical protein